MVLLTEDNFPVTFGFLRKLGLELYDDNGRRMLPDFVDLFEGHFEKSEEMHDYVVSYSSEFVFVSIFFLQIIPIFLELISGHFSPSVLVSINEYVYHVRHVKWSYECTKIFTRYDFPFFCFFLKILQVHSAVLSEVASEYFRSYLR